VSEMESLVKKEAVPRRKEFVEGIPSIMESPLKNYRSRTKPEIVKAELGIRINFKLHSYLVQHDSEQKSFQSRYITLTNEKDEF
jgi:hypothetical protein